MLTRYGANAFSYATDSERGLAAISFRADNRMVRFVLKMPLPTDFATSPRGNERSESARNDLCAQETRRRWRALVLVVKAKLEAVASKIATFENEFMAYLVLPNGGTVGEFMAPQIEAAYRDGTPPIPLALPEASTKPKALPRLSTVKP